MTTFYYSGQCLTLDGIGYIVLGYSDYKRKRIVLADMYGNKHTRIVY